MLIGPCAETTDGAATAAAPVAPLRAGICGEWSAWVCVIRPCRHRTFLRVCVVAFMAAFRRATWKTNLQPTSIFQRPASEFGGITAFPQAVSSVTGCCAVAVGYGRDPPIRARNCASEGPAELAAQKNETGGGSFRAAARRKVLEFELTSGSQAVRSNLRLGDEGRAAPLDCHARRGNRSRSGRRSGRCSSPSTGWCRSSGSRGSRPSR